jgi:uncharacterized protein (TIGR03067 family)
MARVITPLVLFVVAFQPAHGAEDAAKADLEKLQGTWSLVKVEESGQDVTKDGDIGKFKVIVKQDKLRFDVSGNGTEMTIKLDPATTPRSIDLTTSRGLAPGIYEVDKDSFKLSWTHVGKERPKSFETKQGVIQFTLTLKRDK